MQLIPRQQLSKSSKYIHVSRHPLFQQPRDLIKFDQIHRKQIAPLIEPFLHLQQPMHLQIMDIVSKLNAELDFLWTGSEVVFELGVLCTWFKIQILQASMINIGRIFRGA